MARGNKSRPARSEVERVPVGPLCLRMQRGIGHPIIIRRVASLEEGLELREKFLESGEWFRVIVWRYTGSVHKGLEPATVKGVV